MATNAVITAVQGQAWMVGADGERVALRPGMRVPADANIVTAEGARVVLDVEGQGPVAIGGERQFLLGEDVARADVDPAEAAVQPQDAPLSALAERLIAGADPLEGMDETAAVLAGSGGDGGSSFTRLMSVVEPVSPLALAYPRPGVPTTEDVRLGGSGEPGTEAGTPAPGQAVPPPAPPAPPQLLALAMPDRSNEDGESIAVLDVSSFFNHSTGATLVYTVTGLPPGLQVDPATGLVTGTLDRSASQGGTDGSYTVTVTATDPDGNSTSTTFEWGAVNPPPLAVDDEATTEENTVVTGNVLHGKPGSGEGRDSDPDNDPLTVTHVTGPNGTVPAGQPVTGDQGGRFIINPDGSYTFDPGTDFDYLKPGETAQTTVTYTISDGEGGTDTAVLVITITGTDDVPVFTGSDTGSVTEDVDVDNGNVLRETGQLRVQDADAGQSAIDTAVAPVASAGALGSLTINAQGDWTYTVDNAVVQDMNEGVTRQETFTVRSVDGSTHDIVITITGTNDAPVITSDDAQHRGAVREDDAAANTATGTLTYQDIDLGHSITWTIQGTTTGQYGTITLDQNGQWVYTLDNGSAATNALKAGETVTETFIAVVTDDNGATDTQQLVITITGSTDGNPVITPKDENGGGALDGHITVHEKGLTGDDTSHITTGTIAVEALDGLKSIQITTTAGVQTLDVAALQALTAGTPVVLNVAGGTLTLTGFSVDAHVGGVPTEGTLSYTYELTQAQDHSDPAHNTALNLSIDLGVTDVRDVQHTGTLVVQVVDDGPTAEDDKNAVTEGTAGGAASTASGNVLRNGSTDDEADRVGADGAKVIEMQGVGAAEAVAATGLKTIPGKYGTLTIDANGNYSYQLNNGNSDVNKLKDGESLEDEFLYTIRDGDGDLDTAKLTITINGTTDGDPTVVPEDRNGNIAGQVTVNEKGLGDAADTSETATGTIAVTAPDGLTSITVGDPAAGGKTFDVSALADLAVTPVTIDVGHGTITLTGFTPTSFVGGVPTAGTLSYTYTLGARQDHDKDDGKDASLTLDIPLAVLDEGGGTGTGTLVVNVVDDVPVAQNDTRAVAGGSHAPVDGNVLSNDRHGADGPATVTGVKAGANSADAVGPVATTGTEIQGAYGKLTLHPNGSYTYVRDPKTPGEVDDVFTYVITDRDGDTSLATLTVTIGDGAPSIGGLTPAATDGELTVFEKHLTDGTDPNTAALTKGETFTISSPDGIASLTVGGVAVITNNAAVQNFGTHPLEIATSLGNTLTITGYNPTTGVVSYTYTLKDNTTTHTGAQDEQLFDDLSIVLKDMDGDETTGTLSVRIVDDAPVVTGEADAAKIIVDESSLNVSASADFSALFSTKAGADGELSRAYTLEVVNGNPSGLVDTATGKNVLLFLTADGKVEGRLDNATGEKVLEISINASTGAVTLTQLRAVTHGNTSNPDDSVHMANGVVSVKLTVTDGDNDTGSHTVAVGGRFEFKDDGPSITQRDVDLDAAGQLVVKDAETIVGSSAATLSFAAVFGVLSSAAGADGQQGDIGWTYALGVANATSGLTSGGQPVVLSLVDGKVLGTAGGKTVFEIAVNTVGEVTVTQHEAVAHADGSSVTETRALGANLVTLTATARIVDGDGDAATSVKSIDLGTNVLFTDHGPSIGEPKAGTVEEKHLAEGSATNVPETTQTGSLAVNFGADAYTSSGQDTYFTSTGTGNTVTTLQGLGLTSGGEALVYTVSADGHTVTAHAGVGGPLVFTVLIENPSTTPSYAFTLHRALDHVPGTPNKAVTLRFTVEDADGDTVSSQFQVTVVDDVQLADRPIEVNEDGTVSFNTTADGATSDVTVPAKGATGGPGHGTVTVDPDTGRITYEPDENFSGTDTFTYTTVENGISQSTTVTVTVHPVADAPDFGKDGDKIDPATPLDADTNEDVAVALGLKAPVVTDAVDKSPSPTDNMDNPELLGVITLSGMPAGSKLQADALDGTAVVDVTVGANGQVKIVLTDGSHIQGADAEPGVVLMTQAQFEALKVLPPAEDHDNFTVTVSVTSYEVDASGTPRTGVDGATTTITVDVVVKAVTDPIKLEWTDPAQATQRIDEDTSINLKNWLAVSFPADYQDGRQGDGVNGADIDGSEERWIEIKGLPVGSTIESGGTKYTVTEVTEGGNTYTFVKIPTPGLSSGTTLPDLILTPPQDYSGSTTDITVTLVAKDRDADGSAEDGEREVSTVSLTLHVDPVGGDVKVDGITINEDTAATFLASLVVTDDNDGTETITGIVISGIPEGWVLSGATGTVVNGAYTVSAAEIANEAWKSFTLTPPAHSSKDAKLTVSVTSTDVNTVDGLPVSKPKTVDLPLTITVRPVAEVIDPDAAGDTDGDGVRDLTMTGGFEYQTTVGLEDAVDGFALNVEGFNLAAGWANQDSGSESTYALLTPQWKNADGDWVAATGARFTYTLGGTEYEETFDGTMGVQIPQEALGTVKFFPPEHVAGEFQIKVEARTIDADEDNDGHTASADSGLAWLTGIKIAPDADPIESLSVGGVGGRAQGPEDTFIALSIRPVSRDPSETFNVRIGGIPTGATLRYGDAEFTFDGGVPVLTGQFVAGAWQTVAALGLDAAAQAAVLSDHGIGVSEGKLMLSGYDNGAGLSVRPPHNSNADFTLAVEAQTVDTALGQTELSDFMGPKDLPVRVHGVADEVDVTLNAVPTYAESAVEGGQGIKLSDLVARLELTDADGSEKLSAKLTGLAEGFTVQGAVQLGAGAGAAREWLVELNADGTIKGDVRIVGPEHYSGVVTAQLVPTSTENDGHSTTWAPVELKAIVTPTPESTMTLSSGIAEDVGGAVNFSLTGADASETLTAVWVKAADIDGKGFVLTIGGRTLAELADDVGVTTVTRDGAYIKLTGAAIDSVHAQADPNFAHNLPGAAALSFDVRYEVTDARDDVAGTDTIDPVAVVRDANYTLNVGARTDDVDLSPDGVLPALVNTTGIVNIAVTLSKLPDAQAAGERDTDGSEQFIAVRVSAPQGVLVQGLLVGGVTYGDVSYLGGDEWVVHLPVSQLPHFVADAGNPDGTIQATLKLEVTDFLADGDHRVSITVVTRDSAAGDDDVKTDTLYWDFSADFDGPGTASAIDDLSWERTAFEAKEDDSFTLGDAFKATVSVSDGDDAPGATETVYFSFVIDQLPAGAQLTADPSLSGLIITRVEDAAGNEQWVITGEVSGADKNAQLADILSGITVTPPANWNDEAPDSQNGLPFDVTFTAYLNNGSQQVLDAPTLSVPVTPVTDAGTVTVTYSSDDAGTAVAPREGEPVDITLNVASGADHGALIVGDKLYFRLTENFDGKQGTLTLKGDTTPLTMQAAAGSDLPDGVVAGEQYYVIDLSGGASLPVELTYTPHEDAAHYNGSLSVDAWVLHQETGADNWETGRATGAAIELDKVNNGYEFLDENGDVLGDSDVFTARGDENQTGSGRIALDIRGQLIDQDGSEAVHGVLLKGLPVGFLVFVGGVQAENTGSVGSGAAKTNIWSLPVTADGQLPADISIQPPRNWSGTLENLELVVVSGERSGVAEREVTAGQITLVVDAKADGVLTFSPAPAFGTEGDIVALRLNLAMADGGSASVPGAPDASTETATVQLVGLGQYAAFYVGSGAGQTLLDSTQVVHNAETDTYTISGLTQAQVDTLAFVQSSHGVGSQVTVRAWTVDGEAGALDTSVVTPDQTFVLDLKAQKSTDGDDMLLYGDALLQGGLGTDTVWLRLGEDLDFEAGSHAANLKNIEVIDLTREGFGHELSNLSAADIAAMTSLQGGKHLLTVLADQNDSLTLSGEWVHSTEGGFDVYASASNSQVTLRVTEGTDVGYTPYVPPAPMTAPFSLPDVLGDENDGTSVAPLLASLPVEPEPAASADESDDASADADAQASAANGASAAESEEGTESGAEGSSATSADKPAEAGKPAAPAGAPAAPAVPPVPDNEVAQNWQKQGAYNPDQF